MKIEEMLPLECIKIGLVAKNKKEAISRMVELAAKSGKVKEMQKVKQLVCEREELATTGIGCSVALPHTKSHLIVSMVASFAILKTPVNFDAIDEKPVNILLLLLSNEKNVGMQLRILSSCAKLLSNQEIVNKLLKCSINCDIIEILNEIEI